MSVDTDKISSDKLKTPRVVDMATVDPRLIAVNPDTVFVLTMILITHLLVLTLPRKHHDAVLQRGADHGLGNSLPAELPPW